MDSFKPISAWYRIAMSPHEWTWTQDEQEEMARHVLRLLEELEQVKAVVETAKSILKDIEKTVDCSIDWRSGKSSAVHTVVDAANLYEFVKALKGLEND